MQEHMKPNNMPAAAHLHTNVLTQALTQARTHARNKRSLEKVIELFIGYIITGRIDTSVGGGILYWSVPTIATIIEYRIIKSITKKFGPIIDKKVILIDFGTVFSL